MRTMIAIPCFDMMHTLFVKSLLSMQCEGEVEITFATSSLVYDARNNLAKIAIERGFDRILWLDSDMTFSPDIFKRISKIMDAGAEMVSGLYFKRREPFEPVIYKFCDLTDNDKGIKVPGTVTYDDYPKDTIFEIEACGFGGVMTSVELIKRVAEKFGAPFMPAEGFGEDMSFCRRVKAIGAKMFCDSSVKMGHVGYRPITEEDWGQ